MQFNCFLYHCLSLSTPSENPLKLIPRLISSADVLQKYKIHLYSFRDQRHAKAERKNAKHFSRSFLINKMLIISVAGA